MNNNRPRHILSLICAFMILIILVLSSMSIKAFAATDEDYEYVNTLHNMLLSQSDISKWIGGGYSSDVDNIDTDSYVIIFREIPQSSSNPDIHMEYMMLITIQEDTVITQFSITENGGYKIEIENPIAFSCMQNYYDEWGKYWYRHDNGKFQGNYGSVWLGTEERTFDPIDENHEVICMMTPTAYERINEQVSFNATNDMVIGGLPLSTDDLSVNYYKSPIDNSHNFTFTNNREDPLYLKLDLTTTFTDANNKTYRNVVYNHLFKNSVGGIYENISYSQFSKLDNAERARWLTEFFWDERIFADEIASGYWTSKEDTARALITTLLAYQTKYENLGLYDGNVYAIYPSVYPSGTHSQDYVNQYCNTYSYPVYREYNAVNYYSYQPYVMIEPLDTIKLTIPETDLAIQKGYIFDWNVYISKDVTNDYIVHSTYQFEQTTDVVYSPSDDRNNALNNNVVDDMGTIVGNVNNDGYYELGNNGNKIDISSDPEIDTSNITSFIKSIGTIFDMFYNILPAPVMTVIVFGLSVLIAVGIIRLVVG